MQVFLRFICIFLRFYLVISKKSSTFAGFFKESTLKSVSRIARRVVAQPGRVRVWGACGRWFESSLPDHFFSFLFSEAGSFCGSAFFFEVFSCIFYRICLVVSKKSVNFAA